MLSTEISKILEIKMLKLHEPTNQCLLVPTNSMVMKAHIKVIKICLSNERISLNKNNLT